MQDFWRAVETAGGGLSALLLIVAGVAIWRLFLLLDRAKDDRLTDAKQAAAEHREMLEAALKAMAASEQTIREALHELRRRQ